jgi:hypothetical protein
MTLAYQSTLEALQTAGRAKALVSSVFPGESPHEGNDGAYQPRHNASTTAAAPKIEARATAGLEAVHA